MSLYGDYILERENRYIIETEDAFLTYRLFENELYVEDVFVRKEKRMTGLGRELVKKAEAIARESGRHLVTTTVRPSANGSTESLKAILAMGGRLLSSGQDSLVFVKEI